MPWCVLDRTAQEVEEQMSIWCRFLHHDGIGFFLDRYDRLESVPRLGLLVEIYRGWWHMKGGLLIGGLKKDSRLSCIRHFCGQTINMFKTCAPSESMPCNRCQTCRKVYFFEAVTFWKGTVSYRINTFWQGYRRKIITFIVFANYFISATCALHGRKVVTKIW